MTAWPIRLGWCLWWMKGNPVPSTPADLSVALARQPPKEPSTWAVGWLMDSEARTRLKRGGPLVEHSGPILPVGTRIISGRSMPDGCDGFDTQLVTIASGPWEGTLVHLDIGRAGESRLIARLGIMPANEPLASDRAAAATLLERLRDVERQNPSR